MSDASSIVPDPNRSVSTDTEESFLIRQINKSQLFNNSTSSSSGSSGRKQRRSFFRESYIDETGANKSFSVYQDVINETSDESRDVDLSGLSSLNLKMIGGDTSVLGELDGNKSISRSASVKDQELKRSLSSLKRNTSRLSERSGLSNEQLISNTSTQNISTHNYSSHNLSSFSDFSLLQQRIVNTSVESHLIRIPTPEQRAPSPPNIETARQVPIIRPVSEDQVLPQIYAAYAHDQPMISVPSSNDSASSLKQPRKQKSHSTLSSNNSAYSNTRRSIRDYEISRKRSPGFPHLLITRNESNNSNEDLRIQNVQGVARRGLGFSLVGVTPSIHSPLTPTGYGPESDDMEIQRSKQHLRDLEMQNLGITKKKSFNNANITQPYNEETYQKEKYSIDSSDSDDFLDTEDPLLKKIQYYRNQRPSSYGTEKHSDTIGWVVFCISFIVPPLFFFLGFGILDQFIGLTSSHIKKLSLVVGILILLISLACIGIGFGVGLSSL